MGGRAPRYGNKLSLGDLIDKHRRGNSDDREAGYHHQEAILAAMDEINAKAYQDKVVTSMAWAGIEPGDQPWLDACRSRWVKHPRSVEALAIRLHMLSYTAWVLYLLRSFKHKDSAVKLKGRLTQAKHMLAMESPWLFILTIPVWVLFVILLMPALVWACIAGLVCRLLNDSRAHSLVLIGFEVGLSLLAWPLYIPNVVISACRIILRSIQYQNSMLDVERKTLMYVLGVIVSNAMAGWIAMHALQHVHAGMSLLQALGGSLACILLGNALHLGVLLLIKPRCIYAGLSRSSAMMLKSTACVCLVLSMPAIILGLGDVLAPVQTMTQRLLDAIPSDDFMWVMLGGAALYLVGHIAWSGYVSLGQSSDARVIEALTWKQKESLRSFQVVPARAFQDASEIAGLSLDHPSQWVTSASAGHRMP